MRGQDARLAKVRAAAAHKRHQAQAAAKAKHKAVERAHEKAQEKAKEKAKERARQKAKARKAEQAQETAQDSRDTGGNCSSASMRLSATSKSPRVSTMVPSRSTMAAWMASPCVAPGQLR